MLRETAWATCKGWKDSTSHRSFVLNPAFIAFKMFGPFLNVIKIKKGALKLSIPLKEDIKLVPKERLIASAHNQPKGNIIQ